MDMTPIVVGMLKPLLWLLPFALAGGVLKSPWFKGWLGEWKVRTLVRRHLDPSVYREFSNVTVRDQFGDTTQIDHVYVSRYGVFVLETKHMGHWISGSRNQPEWTQTIYRHKVRFQNPLRQNHRHVKVLASLLELPDSAFKSAVVFTGDCTFKTEMPTEVRTCKDLIAYFRSFDEQILTDGQVGSICSELKSIRLAQTWQTHRQHVDNLRRRHGTTPSIATAPLRSTADSFAEVAGERLLRAVETRIRNEGRRGVSRAVQVGVAAILGKALMLLAGMFLIWWLLTTAIGNAVGPLQRKVVVVPAPAPAAVHAEEPLPVAPAPVESVPSQTGTSSQPVHRQPTTRELAEQRRQAEETMRILERSTPEVPLALPGSPVVGPSAYPSARDDAAVDAGR
ncbi:MAG: nuclease-related domain-containing protein [Luteimonas sp.]